MGMFNFWEHTILKITIHKYAVALIDEIGIKLFLEFFLLFILFILFQFIIILVTCRILSFIFYFILFYKNFFDLCNIHSVISYVPVTLLEGRSLRCWARCKLFVGREKSKVLGKVFQRNQVGTSSSSLADSQVKVVASAFMGWQ